MRFVSVCVPLVSKSLSSGGIFDLARMTADLQELEAKMGLPDFWSDARTAAGVSLKKVKLERELQQWHDIEGKLSDNLFARLEYLNYNIDSNGHGEDDISVIRAGLNIKLGR